MQHKKDSVINLINSIFATLHMKKGENERHQDGIKLRSHFEGKAY